MAPPKGAKHGAEKGVLFAPVWARLEAKAVAPAAFRNNRITAIAAELAADAGYMLLYGARVARHVHPPDLFVQLRSGEGPAGLAREGGQNGEFLRLEQDVPAAKQSAVGDQVKFQFAQAKGGLFLPDEPAAS
jgi:hypothetical protein